MKFWLSLFFLALASATFAFSDPGLISSKKTFGFFLMPGTDFGSISSGFSLNENLTDGQANQLDFIAYKSPYLLTKNVTKVGLHRKIRLLQLGPVALNGILGGGLVYSPAVGGGLTADVGGMAVLKPIDSFSLSVPLQFFLYNDGVQISLMGMGSYAPNFWADKELYGGLRLDISVLRADMTGSATTAMYFVFGLRSAI